jgi:hypothetical protein
VHHLLKNTAKKLVIFTVLVLCSASAWAAPGLFWKAESPADKTIYLFGTIHTDDNRVTEFSPAVITALKSIDVFMMETQALQDNQILMMPDGNLKDMLSQDELDQVYALTEFHVMHRANVLRMKPWLLAAIFDSPRPLTPFAQDNLLMTQAEDFGKEVRGIESPAEHFSAMDSLSRDEQLLMLRAVLKRSDEQKSDDYEHLIKAYLAGDSEKIAALDEKITGGMLPAALWQRMRSKLLDERNVLMATRIAEAAKSKSLFVAVGASHLAGQGGLLARLGQAGFKLSPLK